MKITTTGLSLLEVKATYPDCFYGQSWYEDESFATEKPPAGAWEFDFTSEHTGKTFKEQKELVGDTVPHPAVLAEALCIHFKETGERLMSNWYSRTSSLGSGGNRVDVGYFDAGGLYVGSYWNDDRSDFIGLSSARKLDTGTLEPIENLSLEKAIEVVKGAGYKVVKEI